MKSFQRLLFVAAAVTVTAGALSSCASPPPEPIPVAVVPPAAPPPPPVALANSVIQAAGAYRLYIDRAAGISAGFADGASVEQSLASGVAYEPKQLMAGAIAYAALVALQSPQFVAEVRTFAVDPNGRRDLAQRLLSDPNYASALPSAPGAAGMISAALQADAVKVHRVGELVKQAAYDVQRQPWSKAEVPARDARLANAKMLSSQPSMASPAEVQRLAGAVTARDGSAVSMASMASMTVEPVAPPYTAAVSRGLALAALAALGEAGEGADASLQPLLEDKSSDFCLNMSKLNVYQCLSVAKPYYEDVFCLGQHVMLDTAQCVLKAATTQKDLLAAWTPPPTATEPSSTARPYAAPPAPKAPARKGKRKR